MINGLTPTDNFKAEEIRFLQTEARVWIEKVNEKILDAANNGQSETIILLYDTSKNDTSEDGRQYYKAQFALFDHFARRGFVVEKTPHGKLIIKW